MRINTLLIRVTLTFLMLVACSATVQAASPAQSFIHGVDAFQKGAFTEAVDAFLPIAESGVENGHLLYNLGNAYLKTGDLGHAIYWYERATSFIPRNADLRFNLDYARSLQVDDQPGKDSILTRVLFFWQDILSARTIQYLVISGNVLLWLGLGILLFCSSSSGATAVKTLTAGALIMLLILAPTALFQFYQTTFAPRGIILPAKAPVRSGRSADATELFLLHAGSRVEIEEETNGYTKIRFGQEMFGWIEQKNVGKL